LASTYTEAERYAEASEVHARALTLAATATEDELSSYERLRLRYSIALRLVGEGKKEAAERELAEVAEALKSEAKAGKMAYGVAVSRGRLALEAGRIAEARKLLERALETWDPEVPEPDYLAEAKFLFAKALAVPDREDGLASDPVRARAYATEAVEGFEALGASHAGEAGEVREWLRETVLE
jgi:tetratricopeptide (TPR) repeat protein